MRRSPAVPFAVVANGSFSIRRTHTPDPQLPDDVCKLFGGFLIRNPAVEF
jgi:hypothetical protein